MNEVRFALRPKSRDWPPSRYRIGFVIKTAERDTSLRYDRRLAVRRELLQVRQKAAQIAAFEVIAHRALIERRILVIKLEQGLDVHA